MTLSAFDKWLTSDPREWSGEKEDAFEKFCEDEGLDPEHAESAEMFEEWAESMAEEAMERAAEARADARFEREMEDF